MDIQSLLASALSLLVYPGGLFFLVLVLVVAGGAPGAMNSLLSRYRHNSLPLVLCALAAAMVPLPDSPVASLPVHGGVAASMGGLVLLLVAARALSGPLSGRALFLAVPSVALAFGCVFSLSGGTSVDSIMVSGSIGMATLRALGGVCLATVVPIVARMQDDTLDPVMAAAGWLVAAYLAFSGFGWAPPFIAIVLVFASLRVAVLTCVLVPLSPQRWAWAAFASGMGTFVCAVSIALFSGPKFA